MKGSIRRDGGFSSCRSSALDGDPTDALDVGDREALEHVNGSRLGMLGFGVSEKLLGSL